MGLGMPEILIIVVVIFFVFGPKRLPSLGKDLGGGIKNFKEALKELKPSWAKEEEVAEKTKEAESNGKE